MHSFMLSNMYNVDAEINPVNKFDIINKVSVDTDRVHNIYMYDKSSILHNFHYNLSCLIWKNHTNYAQYMLDITVYKKIDSKMTIACSY